MYSKSARTHERILSSAALAFRREGLGASVETLMKGAGLTVGGFYAHFRSKEALISETLPHVLHKTRRDLLDGLESLAGAELLHAIAGRYLSHTHRDNPDSGCAMPAVLSEVTRAGDASRRAFTEELERFVAEISPRLTPGATNERSRRTGTDEIRGRVLSTLALCIGGLMLARAVADRDLSNQILRACKALAATPLPRTP